MQFVTTKGNFTIEVYREWAPIGADRFYSLVKNGFYDEQRFFRAVANFVVQFGIHGEPEIAKALAAELRAWRQEVGALMPEPNPARLPKKK